MMSCQETRKWLSPYLDSELGHTKTFEVSEHLRDCVACAARFDEERRVDEMMRNKLAAVCVPAELWSQVTQAVMTPLWVRRLRSRSGLAIAACLVLSLASVVVLHRPARPSYTPWIARYFSADRPDDHPFLRSPSATASARQLLREQYGLSLAMWQAARAEGHHDMQLVSATPQRDALGHEYLEIRLNCCNEPVLLVLAKPDAGSWPMPLKDIPTGLRQSAPLPDGLNLATREIDGMRVVATGRHAVQQIVDSLVRVHA